MITEERIVEIIDYFQSEDAPVKLHNFFNIAIDKTEVRCLMDYNHVIVKNLKNNTDYILEIRENGFVEAKHKDNNIRIVLT